MKKKLFIIGLIISIFIISSLATAHNYWPTNKYGRYDDEHPSPKKYYSKYIDYPKKVTYNRYNGNKRYYQPYYRYNYYPRTRRMEYDFYERREKEFYDARGNRHYDNYERWVYWRRY